MKRRSDKDDLRPEYDLSQLKDGVRGKYYRQAKAGTNLVLIEADLVKAFPSEAAVNHALRLLLNTATAAAVASTPLSESPKQARGGLSKSRRG